MPRAFTVVMLPLLAAAALVPAASAPFDAFLRTAPYELIAGSDPDRWCGEGDDAYVGDDSADLRGVHFALSLDCLIQEESVPDRLAGEVPALEHVPAAAPGTEFLIVRVAHQARYFPEIGSSPHTTQSWIMAGDRRIYVGAVPAAGKFLVLSVPTGAETVLWIEDSGRAQGLDLRTGAQVDPVTGYYGGPGFQAKTSEEIEFVDVEFGTSRRWWTMDCYADPATITRTMWTERLGWAEEGTAFLTVEWWWCGEGTFDDTTWALDKEEALEVMVGTEPAELLDWSERPSGAAWGGAVHTVSFAVPLDAREFRVLFTPVGEVTELANGEVHQIRGRPAPAVWTMSY